MARSCNLKVKCSVCGSSKHATALHEEMPAKAEKKTAKKETTHGADTSDRVTALYTDVIRKTFQKRSCAKVLLVSVYPEGKPRNAVKV